MKKLSWINEFKAFLMRGNVIDLAVGVVIGAAFTAIVTAVVDDIINPIITLISGKVDFADVSVGVFPIGHLISAIVNFLLIAFVVFWMVKVINKFMEKVVKRQAEEIPEPEPSSEEVLLTEIRDLLKEQQRES
jgi:large conductance mechanosensitive channel